MKTFNRANSRNRQTVPSPNQHPPRFAWRLRRWAPTPVALALLIGTGCSTVPRPVDRGASATIVVVPAGAPEYLNYVTPLTKAEALEKGLHDGLLAAVADPRCVILLPLTMGIGAAQGLRGKTPESIDHAERILTKMAATLHFNQRLCETLVELGPGMTGHQWILRQAPPPTTNGLCAPSVGDDGSLLLMVELPFLGLDPLMETEDPAVNPTLRFRVQVRCRAVNLATGERDETFRFGGGLHKLLTWAENDGTRVRIQANRGSRILAERIIKKLFACKLSPTRNEHEGTSSFLARDP